MMIMIASLQVLDYHTALFLYQALLILLVICMVSSSPSKNFATSLGGLLHIPQHASTHSFVVQIGT